MDRENVCKGGMERAEQQMRQRRVQDKDGHVTTKGGEKGQTVPLCQRLPMKI